VSTLLELTAGIAGVVLVLIVLSDLFQSVILPRPAYTWRASAQIVPRLWRIFGAIGLRMRDSERREALYGVFAPAMLVVLIIFWITGLVLGFGLIFYALRAGLKPEPLSYWGATYYAGTSMLTLGYGDIVGQSGLTRALSLVAAAIGLATFAIVTAFFFALFSAFQRREQFIVAMRERTGAPPSGVDLLERHVELEMVGELPLLFGRAEEWIADLMETHLAYPMLSYFRSAHDNQSWVGTIGALLDASALMITTVDAGAVGSSKMLNRLGRHLVNDFTFYYRFEDEIGEVGIERDEFVRAHARLRSKGLKMRNLDEAWDAFAALRATYAQPLNAMALWWRIPPAMWIGDRSIVTRHTPIAPQDGAGEPGLH
jgi:Ion channel